MSVFTNIGLISAREDVNLEPAFWANLPGNFSYIARRSLISNKNFASFASLHTFPAGSKTGNHWGEAITRLETTSGTPYWFNFHERDVGNFTVIGPTGTGKTLTPIGMVSPHDPDLERNKKNLKQCFLPSSWRKHSA